jgi:microcystin-dependent protein
LETKEFSSDKICIKDTCIDQEGLKRLIDLKMPEPPKLKSHFRKGMIVAWQGTSPPPGWKLCDGQNGTPDLRGRFILGSGQGTGLTNRNVGNTGGLEKVMLTEDNMAPHKHESPGDPNESSNNPFGHSGSHKRARNNAHQEGNAWDLTNSSIWRPTTGSGRGKKGTKVDKQLPFNNMPPFYVLAYIMKMNDEVQDSEIKTKAQYQTEVQDLQAKIQNSESKLKTLESKLSGFSDDKLNKLKKLVSGKQELQMFITGRHIGGAKKGYLLHAGSRTHPRGGKDLIAYFSGNDDTRLSFQFPGEKNF